jgi:hypothetical protein
MKVPSRDVGRTEKSAVDPNEMQSLVEKFESNCRMSNPHRATNPVSEREAESSVQAGWVWLQRALRSKMDATNQLRLPMCYPDANDAQRDTAGHCNFIRKS